MHLTTVSRVSWGVLGVGYCQIGTKVQYYRDCTSDKGSDDDRVRATRASRFVRPKPSCDRGSLYGVSCDVAGLAMSHQLHAVGLSCQRCLRGFGRVWGGALDGG